MYFVRRSCATRSRKAAQVRRPYSIHTAGWVTIVDVKDDMAVAQVTHACDGIIEGRLPRALRRPAVPPPRSAATPTTSIRPASSWPTRRARRVRRGLVMLIDRGSDHGVRAGPES